MYLRSLIIAFVLVPALAFAQGPDPIFLQKALTAVQTQRNLAMDQAAVAEANTRLLSDELAKAQAKIKDLEAKPKEDKTKEAE